jgi:methyltransferase (TIGR00027 family)
VFIDDALLEALASGICQVVVIGAGYDARGFRFRSPGVRYYELDQPRTQDAKMVCIRELRLDAQRIEYVAADLTRQSVDEVLKSTDH